MAQNISSFKRTFLGRNPYVVQILWVKNYHLQTSATPELSMSHTIVVFSKFSLSSLKFLFFIISSTIVCLSKRLFSTAIHDWIDQRIKWMEKNGMEKSVTFPM